MTFTTLAWIQILQDSLAQRDDFTKTQKWTLRGFLARLYFLRERDIEHPDFTEQMKEVLGIQ